MDLKISELPIADPLIGSELFELVQTAANKQIPLTTLRDYIRTATLSTIRDGVPSQGDTLNKLYNLIVSIGEFVGNHNASTGLPTTGSGISGAIDKGDYWLITTGGTISGLGTLAIGDVLFAKSNGASLTSDFFYLPFAVLYGNASETVKGVLEKSTVSEINANTATGGTGAPLAVTPDNLASSKYLDQSGSKLSATASGTNTYTATITPAITAYSSTQRFFIRFTNANTGASTLNLNSLGAVSIRLEGRTLEAGDIKAGNIYQLMYDGTNFQILGAGKLNRGSNPEFETLSDSSSEYRFALFSRLGALFKSLDLYWNESTKTFEIGGTSFLIQTKTGTPSGNASIRCEVYDTGAGIGLRIQDKLLRDYIRIISLEEEPALVIGQTFIKDFNLGFAVIEKQITFSIPNNNPLEQHELVDIPLVENQHLWIEVEYAQALSYQTEGSKSITLIGGKTADARKIPSNNIQGNTPTIVESRLGTTQTDGGFNWLLDTTGQRRVFRFQNPSASDNEEYEIKVHYKFCIRVTPTDA